MTLARRVHQASTSVAYRFASDPGGAANMQAIWGGSGYDSEAVEAEFGEDAARAWIDIQNARTRFFAAADRHFEAEQGVSLAAVRAVKEGEGG